MALFSKACLSQLGCPWWQGKVNFFTTVSQTLAHVWQVPHGGIGGRWGEKEKAYCLFETSQIFLTNVASINSIKIRKKERKRKRLPPGKPRENVTSSGVGVEGKVPGRKKHPGETKQMHCVNHIWVPILRS